MKNDTKKTGTKTATEALAQINSQIEQLKIQKTALAEPMKQRRTELVAELLQVETQIPVFRLWCRDSLRHGASFGKAFETSQWKKRQENFSR